MTQKEAEQAVGALCEAFAWCRLDNKTSVSLDGEFDSAALRKLADILDAIK